MFTIETMLKKQGWRSLDEKESHDEFLDGKPGLREKFDLVDDQLANNDLDSDTEMKMFFIENGVEEQMADEAIRLRQEFLTNPFCQLCIRNGKLGIRYLRILHG